MNSDDALIFAKVVQTGSFSKAGKMLGIPKSTLSRRVAQLEERLGVRLLQRTTRWLHLTDVGRGYYRHCERIVEEIQDAEAYIAQMQSTPQGILRVSLPIDFGIFFMGDILADFMLEYPEISLEADLTSRVANLLTEEIDVAIRMRNLKDSSLIGKKLGTFQMGLFAKADYYSSETLPRHPHDLNPNDCIPMTAGDPTWYFQEGAQTIAITPINRYKTNNVMVIQKAVLRGVGISILPEKMCQPYVENQQLIPLLQDYLPSTANIYAVYPSKKFISAKLSVFLDYLQTRFAE